MKREGVVPPPSLLNQCNVSITNISGQSLMYFFIRIIVSTFVLFEGKDHGKGAVHVAKFVHNPFKN